MKTLASFLNAADQDLWTVGLKKQATIAVGITWRKGKSEAFIVSIYPWITISFIISIKQFYFMSALIAFLLPYCHFSHVDKLG